MQTDPPTRLSDGQDHRRGDTAPVRTEGHGLPKSRGAGETTKTPGSEAPGASSYSGELVSSYATTPSRTNRIPKNMSPRASTSSAASGRFLIGSDPPSRSGRRPSDAHGCTVRRSRGRARRSWSCRCVYRSRPRSPKNAMDSKTPSAPTPMRIQPTVIRLRPWTVAFTAKHEDRADGDEENARAYTHCPAPSMEHQLRVMRHQYPLRKAINQPPSVRRG